MGRQRGGGGGGVKRGVVHEGWGAASNIFFADYRIKAKSYGEATRPAWREHAAARTGTCSTPRARSAASAACRDAATLVSIIRHAGLCMHYEALARAGRPLPRDPADLPLTEPSASALAKAEATLLAVTALLSKAWWPLAGALLLLAPTSAGSPFCCHQAPFRVSKCAAPGLQDTWHHTSRARAAGG